MMYNQSEKFQAFLKKEEVTILVVDSGLGGMAICADIARALPKKRHFKTLSLIYFNAWPQQDRGYNRLENKQGQIDTFDRALNSMLQFKPDFIMLACNTLSVLYPSTKFYQKDKIAVIDIVDFGVDMIANKLLMNAKSQVVILGTVTTVNSRMHHERLLQAGIRANRIVLQPCDQLATAIENGPQSLLVDDMIQKFLGEAVSKINPLAQQVLGALCCTHFGYCQDQFQEKLTTLTGKPVAILNPNHHMSDHLLAACHDNGFDTRQHIRVVSKVKWDPGKIAAISERVHPVSTQTAIALSKYEHVPELF